MKAAKKILSLMLAACMAFVLLPLSALADSPPVCEIGGSPYYSLGDALEYALASSTDTPTTIKLLKSISYEGGIKVEDKTVIFDLNNEFDLMVNNAAGTGLEAGEDGFVSFTGYDPENYNGFYVTGVGSFDTYGVYAHDGGQATVSYAEGTTGAVADSGGKVTVCDDVRGHMWGVVADGADSD